MSKCGHGFVVRDIDGANRFLCRECKERFSFYPKRGKQRIPSIADKFSPKVIDETLKPFKYVYAKGAYVSQVSQVTYNFPVRKTVTQTFQFVEDDDE